MLLELFLGVFVGIFLTRLGLPSIFPLLIWLPVVSETSVVWFVLGLASVSVVQTLFSHEHSTSEDVVIGFLVACAGLIFNALFFPKGAFDGIVFPIIVFILFFWFADLLQEKPRSAVGGIILLAGGWWLLHEHAVSASLPAFFLGWWGLSWFDWSIYSQRAPVQKIRDAFLGCASGLLPGVGPGLVNAFWSSGRASLTMGVSNLVFSIGLASQNGSIRSAVAAGLGDVSSIPWYFLVGVFAGSIVFAFILHNHFSALFLIPTWGWFFFYIAGIFWIGGLAACGIVLASYSLRRVFVAFDLSLNTGVLLLVPSILWFYGPF